MPSELTVLGWREWMTLPALGLGPIKAKVDTGAKTCALHAFYVEPFERDTRPWVRFGVHPLQQRLEPTVHCESPLVDHRQVTDSGGHRELRYVIETDLEIGGQRFAAQVTLTDRESMRFRMLLGRNALGNRFLVDSARSFCLGRPLSHTQSQTQSRIPSHTPNRG